MFLTQITPPIDPLIFKKAARRTVLFMDHGLRSTQIASAESAIVPGCVHEA